MRARAVPTSPLSAKAVADCIGAATRAPSIHNTQPWRFQVGRRDIEVSVDRDRQLAALDPTGRQMFMSVGAAVFNLRLALLTHGRVPVQRLLPDPTRPDLVARIQTCPTTVPTATAVALAAEVDRRRTNRLPFRPTAVPRSVLDDLIGAAAAEGARLTPAEPVVRDAILALTRTADERLRKQAAYRDELAAWTGGGGLRRDGVPAYASGPRDVAQRLPLRQFGRCHGPAAFERPTLVVLLTCGDTPYHWVRAGQALQRVLLTATARGLAASPVNQALELPDLRRLVTDQEAGHYAQAILRLGYGEPVRPTPRREVHDVLTADTPRPPGDPAARGRQREDQEPRAEGEDCHGEGTP